MQQFGSFLASKGGNTQSDQAALFKQLIAGLGKAPAANSAGPEEEIVAGATAVTQRQIPTKQQPQAPPRVDQPQNKRSSSSKRDDELMPPPKPPGIIHCFHCGREDPGTNGFWRKVEILEAVRANLPQTLTVRYPGAVKSDAQASAGAKVYIGCSKCGVAYNKWKEDSAAQQPTEEATVPKDTAAKTTPSLPPYANRQRVPSRSVVQSSPIRSHSANVSFAAASSPATAREALFSDVGMDYGGDHNLGFSGTPGTIINGIREGWTPSLRRSPRKDPSGTQASVNPYSSMSLSAKSPTLGKRAPTARYSAVSSSSPISKRSASDLGRSDLFMSSASPGKTMRNKRQSSVTSPPSPTPSPRQKGASASAAAVVTPRAISTPRRLQRALTNWSDSEDEGDQAANEQDALNASPSPARRVINKDRAGSTMKASEITLTKGPRQAVGPFMGREASADGQILLQRSSPTSRNFMPDISSPSRGPGVSASGGQDANKLFAAAGTPMDLDSSWMNELSNNPHLFGSPTKFFASIGIQNKSAGKETDSSTVEPFQVQGQSGSLSTASRRPLPPTVEDAASSSTTSSPNKGTPDSLFGGFLGGVQDELGFLEKLNAAGINLSGSDFNLQDIQTYGAFDFQPQLSDFTNQNLPGFAAHVPPTEAEPAVIFQGASRATPQPALALSQNDQSKAMPAAAVRPQALAQPQAYISASSPANGMGLTPVASTITARSSPAQKHTLHRGSQATANQANQISASASAPTSTSASASTSGQFPLPLPRIKKKSTKEQAENSQQSAGKRSSKSSGKKSSKAKSTSSKSAAAQLGGMTDAQFLSLLLKQDTQQSILNQLDKAK